MSQTSKLLITGCTSMIGREIAPLLQSKYQLLLPSKKHLDLTNYDGVRKYFTDNLPEYVIHLAGLNGGIEFNRLKPATIAWNTASMAQNVLKVSNDCGVKKVLSILASCSYYNQGLTELQESTLHLGPPDKSVECHGYSKRWIDILSRQYYKEFNLNAVCVIMTNTFGPYDRYDALRSKVVGGMIKKFCQAKEDNSEVSCWGRGVELRELIYSKDAARLIVKAFEEYEDNMEPVNIGTPNEVSIKNLSEIILQVVGGQGNIVWDKTKPDGQLRKKLNLDKMNTVLLQGVPFEYTKFETAITDTVKWYMENKNTWTK